MKWLRSHSLVVIAGISLLMAILFICLNGTPRRRPHNPELIVFRQFAQISNALHKFSWDHNDLLPSTLHDLFPRYIIEDQLSDCIYLGAAGIPRGVIAYESETLLNQSSGERKIITPGFGVYTVSASELEQLLLGKDCPVLERLRKDRVTGYEANLHASLNGYRMTFESYPTGDNPSVTAVLRGRNPKEKQFHSSYQQERSPRGEELDPWGTPYWIESDGNRVRIKSAGSNRQFDEPTSSQFDDICSTIAHGSVYGDSTRF